MNPVYNSFSDCRGAMNSAIESKWGIRIKFPSKELAIGFRHKCHKTRQAERLKAAKIYGDAFKGIPIDNLCFNLWAVDSSQLIGEWWLYITHGETLHKGFEAEELEDEYIDLKSFGYKTEEL